MDSRLLNAYHDDPYECYESNITDIWSTNNVEMELAQTLDGILPIAATEVENDTYCNMFYADENIYSERENQLNALVYNDFEKQQLNSEERVATIDASAAIYENNAYEVNVFDAVNINEKDDVVDSRSQYSNTSFRTRTDSSSIGDYESHSSDYDEMEFDENIDKINNEGDDDDDDDDDDDLDDAGDEDDDEDFDSHIIVEQLMQEVGNEIEALEVDDLLTDLPGLNLLNSDQFMFFANGEKQRTMSTNTIDSDVDAANFDLAEFITKDDDLLAKTAISMSTNKVATNDVLKNIDPAEVLKIVPENIDTDSDVIVDVETLEENEDIKNCASLLKPTADDSKIPEDNTALADNINKDPEWNPKELKTKCNKSVRTSTPTSKKISEQTATGKPKKLNTPIEHVNKTATKVGNKKQILKSTQTNVRNSLNNQRHGIGKGGKNLALLKRESESTEVSKNKTEADIKAKEKDKPLLKQPNSMESNKKININNDVNTNKNNKNTEINLKTKKNAEIEKRKLNLDEYKRRYAGEVKTKNMTTTNQIKTATKPMPPKTATTKLPINLSPTKINKPHSQAVTSIVKTLKEQQSTLNQIIDPITLAKNKVLRMQELKRAQQMKIIDSTVSAKVPRVTKLLPLQEIIKDTAYAIKPEKHEKTIGSKSTTYDNHPDYEKIVMVSVACNTALTLSPNDRLPNVPFLEHTTTDRVKISHNSLITSIQDAVVKQSLPKITVKSNDASTTTTTIGISTEQQQHGEDKIIMHLRKDRIREHNTRSIDIQTDFQAAFPTLPLPNHLRKQRHSRRKYRKHESTNALSADYSMESSPSDDEDALNYVEKNSDANICLNGYQHNQLLNGGSTGSICGSSSHSSRRHRSSVSSSYSESGHQRSSRDPKRKSNYRKSMRKKSRTTSSSSESSLSDFSDRSRSRTRHSRSRSRSPLYGHSNARRESNYSADRNVSKPAVEERRIVYVGRIEEETTKEILRRKFIPYGSIRQITVHYKENGMKYGFVTFERAEDAFAVIDNSARDSQINMYDISFGGRRAFCRTSYADLDNAGINNYQSYVFPQAPAPPKQEDSFEALLKKMKAKLDANKTSGAASSTNAAEKL